MSLARVGLRYGKLKEKIMRIRHSILRLVIVLVTCASVTNAQGPLQRSAVTKILIMADNQEHLLTGGSLRSFSPQTERLVTSVGLRSPLANVGGRLLMREVLKFGKDEGVGLVLHLGDAVDISCENELKSVFESMDAETPEQMWFMTPGNHDGLLAGNFAKYQDPADFKRKRPSFYGNPPLNGFGVEKNIWYYACQSPNSSSDEAEMPRGRAIKIYVDWLRRTRGAELDRQPVQDKAEFQEDGEKIIVPCKIERIKINPKRPSAIDGYEAIARICETRQVPKRTTVVGQYASFIVQKIDIGRNRIVLLDTSDYPDPTANVKLVFPIAVFGGELTKKQKTWADRFFDLDGGGRIDRRNVIVAGHHPFAQLPKHAQKWIAERSGRYISAHVHTATSLIKHRVKIDGSTISQQMLELNVGSTLDYPPQAVIGEINSNTMSVRVAGAGTNWLGFVGKCEVKANEDDKDKWKLDKEFYQNYGSGLYLRHLLRTLREATDMHDVRIGHSSLSLEIPTGTKTGDWTRLEKALKDINDSKGESRIFWACQAYYASLETKSEKGLADRLAAKVGLGFNRGENIRASGELFLSP